ncbi:MAG: serine/threonine protein kinase [Gammaproteobacteria bacterium]
MPSINALRSYLNGLPADYQLHWYKIDQIIGQGAFGITYLAEDVNLDRKVAIKEYMPAQLAVRAEDQSAQPISMEEAGKYFWGKDRFLNEARLLADVEHPSVVQVLSVFETNNTAYMVMQYERGESLDNILKRHGTLEQNQLLEVLYPIMEGLEYIHSRNIIHRDVKPGNIYIREEGPPVLLDFGSARRSLQTRTAQLTSLVTPGYAPIEQYGERASKQGPWTDIYGLGATLHRCITGSPPPDAINRSESIATESLDTYCPSHTITEHEFSPILLSAIESALAFKPKERPQSIQQWKASFEDQLLESADFTQSLFTVSSLTENYADKDATTHAEHPHETYANPYQRTKNVSRAWIAAMVVITLGVIAGYLNGTFSTTAPEDLNFATDDDASFSVSYFLSDVFSDSAGAINQTPSEEASAAIDLALPSPDLMTLAQSPTREAIATATLKLPTSTLASASPAAPSLGGLLAAAERDVLAQRLTRPAGNNALEKYRAALLIDRDNPQALSGLDSIVASYKQLVEAAISKNEFDEAEKLIDRAKGISATHKIIAEAENALEIAQYEYAIENLNTPIEGGAPASLASVESPPRDSQKRAERFVQQISGENNPN